MRRMKWCNDRGSRKMTHFHVCCVGCYLKVIRTTNTFIVCAYVAMRHKKRQWVCCLWTIFLSRYSVIVWREARQRTVCRSIVFVRLLPLCCEILQLQVLHDYLISGVPRILEWEGSTVDVPQAPTEWGVGRGYPPPHWGGGCAHCLEIYCSYFCWKYHILTLSDTFIS